MMGKAAQVIHLTSLMEIGLGLRSFPSSSLETEI